MIYSILKQKKPIGEIKLLITLEMNKIIYKLSSEDFGVSFLDIFDEEFLETKDVKRKKWNFNIGDNFFKLDTLEMHVYYAKPEEIKMMVIPSNLHRIKAIEKIILYDMSVREYTEKDISEMKLILDELLVNAIEHGNKFDLNKSVYLSYEFNNENQIRIEVEDEGEGFDIKTIKDPDLLNERGRGIYIVRKLVKTLEYMNDGKKVIITI